MTTRKSHKARGANFETDLRDYFRRIGFDSERLARTGARDEGDVVVRQNFLGHIGIIEAQIEATHYSEARGIQRASVLSAVVIKARGKSIEDSYLVLRLGDVFDG